MSFISDIGSAIGSIGKIFSGSSSQPHAAATNHAAPQSAGNSGGAQFQTIGYRGSNIGDFGNNPPTYNDLVYHPQDKVTFSPLVYHPDPQQNNAPIEV